MHARGAEFLEAPVSFSKDPAETGNLFFQFAGEHTVLKAATRALDVMGKRSLFLFEEVSKS